MQERVIIHTRIRVYINYLSIKMEPAEKKIVVAGTKLKVKTNGNPLVNAATSYYKSVEYDPLLVMKRLVPTRKGYDLHEIYNLEELESWLVILLDSTDRELRAVVLKLLSRLNKMQDPIGIKLVRLHIEPSIQETQSEEDLDAATETLSKLSMSAKYSPIIVDEEYFIGPDDTEMYLYGSPTPKSNTPTSPVRQQSSSPPARKVLRQRTPSPPPKAVPARTPSGSKRLRQASPLKDSGEYKRSKKDIKTVKARSSWVMNEEIQIESSPDQSLVENVLEVAEAYNDKKMWEFLFHVPNEISEDTLELSDDFTNDDFWEWFNQIEDFFGDYSGFDFTRARRVSSNKSLKGEHLIDAVVNAGYNK